MPTHGPAQVRSPPQRSGHGGASANRHGTAKTAEANGKDKTNSANVKINTDDFCLGTSDFNRDYFTS